MDFDLFLAQMLGEWWHGVSALVLLFLAARGIGCWLLPRSGDEFVRSALGAALLAWVYPWWWPGMPAWLSVALLLVPAGRGAWGLPWRRMSRDWKLYLLLGIFGAFTLGSAFLPPFTWDEQVYQTFMWARFPETLGKTDNPYSAYPLLPHFFLMWVREWSGLSLPRLAVWLLSLLLAGKLYVEAKRRSGSCAWGAALTVCVMLSPTALILHQGFYAESFIAFFALAGFLTLENEDVGADDDMRRQLLAGVFAGACVAVKLTGVGAALMLTIIASKRRRFQWFSLTASLTALPFFIRPWLTFGNPFYPFGSALWGGDSERLVENVYRAIGDYGYGKLAGVAAGWLTVCFSGPEIHDGVCGFGVLALVILLLLGLWRRRDKSMLISFAALAAGYLFWALTSQQSRFLYPLLFPLALVAADVFMSLTDRRTRWAALALPILGMLFSLHWICPQLVHHVTAWRMLVEGNARSEPRRFLALTRDFKYFNTLKLLGKVAPKDARVLLLCERRGLYVPRRCEHGSPLFQNARLTPPPRTPDELWRGIRDFDYILFGSGQGRMDHLESYDGIEASMELLLVELVKQGKLRPVLPPAGVQCQPLLEVVHEP